MSHTVVRFVEDSILHLCVRSHIVGGTGDGLVSAKYKGSYYPAVILGEGDYKGMSQLLQNMEKADMVLKQYSSEHSEFEHSQETQKTVKKNQESQTEITFSDHYKEISNICIASEDREKSTASLKGGQWLKRPSQQKLTDASGGAWEDRPSKRAPVSPSEDLGDSIFPTKEIYACPLEEEVAEDLCATKMYVEEPAETEQTKQKGKKKYFCIFCKSLVSNFARHLFNNHKEREEVLSMSNLPKKSKERQNLLKELRGRGSIFYNSQYELNKGILIVSRRKEKTVDSYKPCPHCKNYYVKDSLYKHYKECSKQSLKQVRCLQSTSSSVIIQQTHEGKASNMMLTDILPGMVRDDIAKSVLEDPFIIDYGNYLCVKHKKDQHLKNHIRNKLRQIANLLNTMKEMNPEITTLKESFKPQYFDTFMEAVKKASGYCSKDGSFRAPSLVTQLGHGMKLCAERLSVFCIKTENEKLRAKVTSWLEVYTHEYYNSLGKLALEDAAKKKWNRPRLLPLTEDIIKLNQFLKSTIVVSEESLSQGFDKHAFENLNKAILLQILIFNRKRVGESERLLLDDFNRRHNIQKDSEVYNSLSNSEKVVAARYSRIEFRGKKGRPVSLLISDEQARSIQNILSLREAASVAKNNRFVFGRGKDLYYNAAKALRDAAWECGACRADLITGTALRKEIATTSQVLNFTDNDMAVLADFMGHNIETHRHFYRMPSEVTHLARISQLLIALDEGNISKFHGKTLEEINVDIELNMPVEPNLVGESAQDIPLKKKKAIEALSSTTIQNIEKGQIKPTKQSLKTAALKTPPKTSSNIRQKWKTPERHKTRSIFANNIEKGLVPSASECMAAIKKHHELRNRSVAQLKTWVYYEIKRNKKSKLSQI